MDKGQHGRIDRLIKEKRHDPYMERQKWPEPTVCSQCQAVFLEGRWTWYEPPVNANPILCPACQRIKDDYPAGQVEIRGDFYQGHQDEINNLISNLDKQEKTERPMERLMAMKPMAGHVLVTTTGIHLARRIGEALNNAYQGKLDFTYGDGEKSIRVSWERQ